MIQKEVTAQVPEKKDAEGNITQNQLGPVTGFVNYPETLAEAEEMYGADAILSNAFANWRVVVQAGIRTDLKKGKSADDILEACAGAVMGVAREGGKVDPMQAVIAKFKMSDDAGKADILAQLQAAAEE